MKTKRKLKPIPRFIFNVIKYVVIGVVGFYLMAYLFCFCLLINAEQMDNRYEYMEQQLEVYQNVED